jgi:predicted secreted protein
MQITSIIAIYALFWVLSAFLVMPFGIRTPDESGEQMIAGQADSAPSNFRPGRVALRATLLSLVLFGLYYVNYVNGWIQAQDLNFFGKPPV